MSNREANGEDSNEDTLGILRNLKQEVKQTKELHRKWQDDNKRETVEDDYKKHARQIVKHAEALRSRMALPSENVAELHKIERLEAKISTIYERLRDSKRCDESDLLDLFQSKVSLEYKRAEQHYGKKAGYSLKWSKSDVEHRELLDTTMAKKYSLEEENQRLLKKLEIMENNLMASKDEKLRLSGRYKNAERELDKKRNDESRLKREMQQLQKILQDKEEDINKLKKKNTMVNESYQNALIEVRRSKYNESRLGSEMDQLKHTLENKEEEIKELQKDVIIYQNAEIVGRKSRDNEERLAKEMLQQQEILEGNEKEIMKLHENTAKLSEKYVNTERVLEKSRSDIRRLRIEMQQQQQNLKDKEKEIKHLIEDATKLNDRCQNTFIEISRLRNNESSLGRYMQQLKQTLEAKEEEIKTLRQDAIKLKEGDPELTTLLEKKHNLQTQLQDASVKASESNQQLTTRGRANAKPRFYSSSNFTTHWKQTERPETLMEYLKKDLKDTDHQLTELYKKRSGLKETEPELTMLWEQRHNLKTQLEVLKIELSETKQHQTASDKVLPNSGVYKGSFWTIPKLKRLGIQIQDLSRNLKDTERQLTEQYGEKSGLVSKLRDSKEEIESLKLKEKTTRKEITDLQESHERLVSRLSATGEENKSLKLQEQSTRKELTDVRANNEKLVGKLNAPGEAEESLKLQEQSTRKELTALPASNESQLSASRKEVECLKLQEQSTRKELTDLRANNEREDIGELSDPNRPMKLAEKVSELYDNQWTNAMENLEDLGLDDDKSIKLLLKIFTESYRSCREAGGRQLEPILSGPYIALPDIENVRAKTTNLNVMIEKFKKMPEFSDDIVKACEDFIQHSVKYTWMMVIQDPPVHMEWEFSHGDEFDNKRLRSYTKGGQYLDFMVWPVLYLHEGGPLLAKGVAQGMKHKN